MERIWLNLLLSARSQVQLQEKTLMMNNNINAEEASVGVETRAQAIINDNNNKRRRLLLLSAPVPEEIDEATDDIECLDHIRTAARHHGGAIPCRSCLPRDIRTAPALQPYLAAWSASNDDHFLCATDLLPDDVSTEDIVSTAEEEDGGH